jgi:hypothetical protein
MVFTCQDDGLEVLCSAVHSLLSSATLEQTTTLDVKCKNGTVTFCIQTFFIRYKVYTNFLYTGQSLYGTKFIQDKVYTGTKFIRGQSLYGDKVYTGTKFIR